MLLALLTVIYPPAAVQDAPGCQPQPWDRLMHLHPGNSGLKDPVTARVLFNWSEDA